MNFKVYFFRDDEKGYFQHPSDGTDVIFRTFMSKTKGQSQISIHRDGSLVYYGYTQKLRAIESGDDNQVAGICIVFQDYMCAEIEHLYSILDRSFFEIVKTGRTLKICEDGDIDSDTFPLSVQRDDIERISDIIKSEINKGDLVFIDLPELECNIAAAAEKTLEKPINDSDKDIFYAISSTKNIYIPINAELKKTLTSIYAEKIKMDYLIETNIKLEEKNSKLLKLRNVFRPLFIVVFFCVILGIVENVLGGYFDGHGSVVIYTCTFLVFSMLCGIGVAIFKYLNTTVSSIYVWLCYIIMSICAVL